MTLSPFTALILLLAFLKYGYGDSGFTRKGLNDILKSREMKEADRDLHGFISDYIQSHEHGDIHGQGAETQTPGVPLGFASYYGDHMVLQQSPKAAYLWGYADPRHIGSDMPQAVWSFHLMPVASGGPYDIKVQLEDETVTICDVLFGDVWFCSGQSNMEFTVSQLTEDDLSRELANVGAYADVRMFTPELKLSASPQYDLIAVRQPWSVASAESIAGGGGKYFSAVCWLYGRRLSATRGYPIGLLAAYWGNTRVEAWSSSDALKMCDAGPSEKEFERPMDVLSAHNKSVLWNAMIHPFLNMTIYGAIWYQGESNDRSVNYNCTFPAMISDWRAKFHAGSGGETDPMFPFGFVQLAPFREIEVVGWFPLIRWQQTANVGYVPNPKLPHVFMAVAMDLPDFQSPYYPIHSRYKETVADRLLLSGLSVAYGQREIKFQGPFPSAFYVDIKRNGKGSMRIEFDEGHTPLVVRSLLGFEVCCLKSNTTWCQDNTMGHGSGWNVAPIIAHDTTTVTIQTCEGAWIMGLRYAWRESPCRFKACPVYSVENSLPAPPFIMNGIFGNTATPARKWVKF